MDEAPPDSRWGIDVGDKSALHLQDVPKPFHVAPGEGQIAKTHRSALSPVRLEPERDEE